MFRRVLLALAVLIVPVFIMLPSPAGAVDVITNDVCRKDGKDSTVCKQDERVKGKNPLFGEGSVLEMIISLLSIVVGIAAVIGIIIGGLKFVTSGNNPQEVTKARETVIYALVALAVAALAQVIVRFVISGVA